MLVTLDEMKTRLGIPLVDTSQDTFLTEQLNLMSETIENYCGRKFESSSYVQTFYRDEMASTYNRKIPLFHFPIVSITHVKEIENDYTLTSDDYRMHKPSAMLTRNNQTWFAAENELEVSYEAGYASIPEPIRDVVFSLVEERYNKNNAGVNLNFGSDVQSVSIPGTISVAFDYSLQTNERKNAFGMILGNYGNVLDFYRSERVVVGTIREAYVE